MNINKMRLTSGWSGEMSTFPAHPSVRLAKKKYMKYIYSILSVLLLLSCSQDISKKEVQQYLSISSDESSGFKPYIYIEDTEYFTEQLYKTYEIYRTNYGDNKILIRSNIIIVNNIINIGYDESRKISYIKSPIHSYNYSSTNTFQIIKILINSLNYMNMKNRFSIMYFTYTPTVQGIDQYDWKFNFSGKIMNMQSDIRWKGNTRYANVFFEVINKPEKWEE